MGYAEILVCQFVSSSLQLLDFLTNYSALISHQRQEKADFIKIVNRFHVSRNFNLPRKSSEIKNAFRRRLFHSSFFLLLENHKISFFEEIEEEFIRSEDVRLENSVEEPFIPSFLLYHLSLRHPFIFANMGKRRYDNLREHPG